MYTFIDEDEFETVVTSRPCTSCGGNLGKCRGIGCNGSFGVGSRRRSDAEIKEIKAKRQREHEDKILAEAEMIKAQRSFSIRDKSTAAQVLPAGASNQ
jgi:hypothetical protein